MKIKDLIRIIIFGFFITQSYAIQNKINYNRIPEILKRKASLLIKSKKYIAALKHLKKIIGLEKYQKESIYKIAYIYFKKRLYNKSLNYINKYLFIDPFNQKALILKGKILSFTGKGASVIQTYIKIKNESNYIFSLLIKNYLKSNNIKMMKFYINKYINNNPKAIDLYYLGCLFFKNKYYWYSINAFNRALQKGLRKFKIKIVYKKIATIYYKLAVENKLKYRFKSAIYLFKKVKKYSQINSINYNKSCEQIQSIKKLQSLIKK